MLSESRARRCRESAIRHLAENPEMSLHNSMRLLDAGIRDAAVLDLAAIALLRGNRFVLAAPILEELRTKVTETTPVLDDLVSCYTAMADYSALVGLETDILALNTALAPGLLLQIRLLNALNRHEQCIPLCQQLLHIHPEEAEYWCMLAWHQQSRGELDAAGDSYDSALEVTPGHVRAHYARSQVGKATPERNHLGALQCCLAGLNGSNYFDLASIHSALGKEYEDLGDYAHAFEHFDSCAALVRPQGRYNAVADERVLSSAARWVSKQLESGVPRGFATQRPIFIVGMPRTGSTLLDRMLSNHSEVSSAGELLCFRTAVQELYGASSRGDFFEHFFERDDLQLEFAAIGQRYCELSAAVAGDALHFTDKLPMNYFLMGLIAMALPGARFIRTVRNPLDTCFSVYKQLFGPNFYNYSYGLEDVAQHYALQHRLVAHWQQCFPGRILDVPYEELVTNPREQLGAVLQHCNLQWEDNCLDFQRNRSAVTTASSTQVRQPLYSSSIGKWRNYRPWLQPLISALQSAGVDLQEHLDE